MVVDCAGANEVKMGKAANSSHPAKEGMMRRISVSIKVDFTVFRFLFDPSDSGWNSIATISLTVNFIEIRNHRLVPSRDRTVLYLE